MMHSQPTLCSYLAARRLRFFQAALIKGPPLLQQLLRDSHYVGAISYQRQLQQDFQWMCQMSPDAQALPDPSRDWIAWCDAVTCRGKRWKRWCAQALLQAGRRAQLEALAQCAASSAETPSPSHSTPPAPTSAFVCEVCGKAFDGQKALAVHRQTAHSLAAAVRKYMPDATFRHACNRDFHSTQKLRQHLQYVNGKCLEKLESIWVPLSDEEVAQVVTVKQCTTAHRLPPRQHFGPQLPTKEQWQTACPHKHFPTKPVADRVLPVNDREVMIADWLLNEVTLDVVSTWKIPPNFFHSNGQPWTELTFVMDTLEAWFPCLDVEPLRTALDKQCHSGKGAQDVHDGQPSPCLPIHCQKPTLMIVHDATWDPHAFVAAHDQIMRVFDVDFNIAFHSFTSNSFHGLASICDRLTRDIKEDRCHGLLGIFHLTSWQGRQMGVPLRSRAAPWGRSDVSHRAFDAIQYDNNMMVFWKSLRDAARAANCSVLQMTSMSTDRSKLDSATFEGLPAFLHCSGEDPPFCDDPIGGIHRVPLFLQSWSLRTLQVCRTTWLDEPTPFAAQSAILDAFLQVWFQRSFQKR